MASAGDGWFYDSADGDVVHFNEAESLLYVLQPWWHGPYKTQAEAEQHTGVKGPAAQVNQSVLGSLGATGSAAVPGTAEGLFNGKIGPSDLVRIGQVLLGIVLLGVAAARITGAENIVSRTIT